MTPATIIQQATADGVNLALSRAGTIKAAGSSDAVNRWLPVIREHKAELLAELKATNDALPPVAEARRQRVMELAGHLRLYAARNSFSRADFDKALRWAMASDLDGWLAYLRLENERHGATVH